MISRLPPSPALLRSVGRSLSITQNQAHSGYRGEGENQEGRTSPCLLFNNNVPRTKEVSSLDVISRGGAKGGPRTERASLN